MKKNKYSLKYAPVHTSNNCKDFPYVLENIEEEMIEWKNSIVFDLMSETVFVNSYYDIDMLSLIVKRMEELKFEKTFTK